MATKMGRKKTTQVKKNKYLCPYCNTEKTEDHFYISTDPLIATGRCVMCKDCAEKIARNWDPVLEEFGDCTKTSIMQALERLDKPYFDTVWDASYFEVHNPGTRKNQLKDIWGAYIKNISMPQYKTLRWRDGDIYSTFRERAVASAAITHREEVTVFKNDEINDAYKKNRSDVIRLLGYDPFESEDEVDKPLLYSQLIGYLDLGGDNDDMMRTSSAITIVRGFLQQSKIDDKIARLMSNIDTAGNSGEIKSLLESKQKLSSSISTLAEQSCLSLKHSKNASKGENTWTGKIKKIKELNLREGEVNGFDIATCRGMQQVMDLSNASILKQLNLDESEYSDIIAEQRQLVTQLTIEKDSYKEIARILLRENLDLKDVLKDNDLLESENLVDLEEIFSPFSETDEDDEFKNDIEDQESISLDGR